MVGVEGAGERWRGSLLGSIAGLRRGGSWTDVTLVGGREIGEGGRQDRSLAHSLVLAAVR